jgi:hypothetical protein
LKSRPRAASSTSASKSRPSIDDPRSTSSLARIPRVSELALSARSRIDSRLGLSPIAAKLVAGHAPAIQRMAASAPPMRDHVPSFMALRPRITGV